MRKISVIFFAVMVSGVLFYSGVQASRMLDKRFSPENVAILDNGIKYMPNSVYDPEKGREYYIEAWDVKTGEKLWEQKIYEILYDLTMEQDAQDRNITSLHVVDGKLMIENENKDEYVLDLGSREVTKITDSKPKE